MYCWVLSHLEVIFEEETSFFYVEVLAGGELSRRFPLPVFYICLDHQVLYATQYYPWNATECHRSFCLDITYTLMLAGIQDLKLCSFPHRIAEQQKKIRRSSFGWTWQFSVMGARACFPFDPIDCNQCLDMFCGWGIGSQTKTKQYITRIPPTICITSLGSVTHWKGMAIVWKRDFNYVVK